MNTLLLFILFKSSGNYELPDTKLDLSVSVNNLDCQEQIMVSELLSEDIRGNFSVVSMEGFIEKVHGKDSFAA
jgi:hypothetical protein